MSEHFHLQALDRRLILDQNMALSVSAFDFKRFSGAPVIAHVSAVTGQLQTQDVVAAQPRRARIGSPDGRAQPQTMESQFRAGLSFVLKDMRRPASTPKKLGLWRSSPAVAVQLEQLRGFGLAGKSGARHPQADPFWRACVAVSYFEATVNADVSTLLTPLTFCAICATWSIDS